ncbi:MAG: hypothetical protein HYZ83_00540 [Candidatus Omnitrophica bacterium]|nr:hypothetical protein [Candidatus Omnitrophota bacterium]
MDEKFEMDAPTIPFELNETKTAAAQTSEAPTSTDFLMTQALQQATEENKKIQSPERVEFSELESEDCKSTGYPENGSTVCKKVYANGIITHVVSDYEMLGFELKQQTILTDFDAAGHKLQSKTIRQKLNFIDEKMERKSKSIDIVNRPLNDKITREIVIIRYYPNGETIQFALWAKYNQIGDTKQAGLSNFISLYYDSKGNPLKGRTEIWSDGKPVSTPFYYRAGDKISKNIIKGWKEQESWVFGIARTSSDLLASNQSSF